MQTSNRQQALLIEATFFPVRNSFYYIILYIIYFNFIAVVFYDLFFHFVVFRCALQGHRTLHSFKTLHADHLLSIARFSESV